MRFKPNFLLSILIGIGSLNLAHSNSILFAPTDHEPWYFGINSEIYNIRSHRAKNYNTTYLALKPYIEYERGSLILSPNLRLAADDAFMLTIGAEAGPAMYIGNYLGVGYNLRVNFTLLKIVQFGGGCRTENAFIEPHYIVDFAIGLHFPILGKDITSR